MFRNDEQLGQVCFILCAWIPSSPWRWDGDGYRRTFFEVPSGISSGEAAMIRFAAALWGGDDLPVWRGFDGKRLRDVGELLVAMGEGSDAIDSWIHARCEKPLGANRPDWERIVRERARS